MTKRTLLILIGILIVLPLFISQFTDPTKTIRRWLSRASDVKSAYAFTAAEIETRLKKIESVLPGIEELIAQRRYQAGRELFDTTFYELRRAQHDAGNTALGEGRTLGGELDRLESRIGQAAHREFATLLAGIAQGGPDTATVHRLVRSFSTLGGNKLAEELTAQSAGLDKIRRTLATRWIRIRIDAANEDYEGMTVDHVVQNLVALPGFTVVFGPPTGPAEEAATFATLTLKITTDFQDYVKVRKAGSPDWSNGFFNDKSAGGLLTRLGLALTVHHAFEGYATSWDQLPGKSGDTLRIDLEIPAPASLEFKLPPGREARDEFKELNVARVAQMKAKLATALAALPPLDFAPARNSPPPTLSRQQALLDEAGFIQAATAALATKKSAGDIACIAVELILEPLADRIESQLDTLTVNERFKLARVLAIHPWYHRFGMLNKLLLSAPSENVPHVLTALQRDFDQAALRKTALTRVLQEKPSHQQNQMMEQLISFSPPEALPDFARIYPTVPAALQSTILVAMMERDRAMAGQFARQLIKSGKPEVVQLVSGAVADALGRINSGRKMTLLPDETAVFVQALAATRGPPREQVIGKLPRSEELLALLLQADRTSWTEAENLELFGCFNGPLPFDSTRQAGIMGAVFKSMKQGRLNTPKLAQKASFVLSPIANQMLRTRGDEQVKIPLILQVIDERSPQNSEICAQSVVAMILSLQLPGVLAHPDARTLLTKGKDYPNERVRQKIRDLTTEAAKTDQSYRDLL